MTILTPLRSRPAGGAGHRIGHNSLLPPCRQEEKEVQQQLFTSTSHCAWTVMKRGRDLRGGGACRRCSLQAPVQQTVWRCSSANLNILAQERLQRPSVRSRTEEQQLGNTL